MIKPLDTLVNRSGKQKNRQRFLLAEMLRVFVRQQLNKLHVARSISRERKVLQNLSDDALNDLGIARDEADKEAARPYHDIPPERLPVYGLPDPAEEKQYSHREA